MGSRGPKSAAELAVVPISTPTKAARKGPSAPKHLTAATRRWWNEVVADFDLESQHLRLLQNACESWDRAQQARAALATLGLTFTDEKGVPRARPEVAIERDSMIRFARLVRELDLSDGPSEGARPPSLGSNRG